MSITTEYSRLLIKRSTVPGVVPTIPTASTIDNTWLTTDLMVGEMFINVADDRVFLRSDNGIIELIQTGGTDTNYYTTGATLVGNTIFFDRNDMLSAYTVDLSTIALTGDYLPLSGGTLTGDLNINTNLYITGNTIAKELSATTFSVLNSGSTTRNYYDYSSNVVQSGVTNSSIVAGSGNTIVSGVRNVLIAGSGITGNTSDTAYFSKVNISTVPTGTTVSTLGVDANGNVIVATGGGSGSSGTSGSSGISGANGSSGSSGVSGSSGTSGSSGVSGANGSSGSSGQSGTSGTSGTSPASGWSADTVYTTSVYQNNSSGNAVANDFALAANRSTTAQGKSAAAFNYQTYAKAEGSVAMGSGSTVSAIYSFSQGISNTIASGSESSAVLGGFSNNIDSNSEHSVIIGGSGNTINPNVERAIILGGRNITADRDDMTYVQELNIKSIYPGTPSILLGVDSSGNVLSASTSSIGSGTFLPLSGGTMTGNIIFPGTALLSGSSIDSSINFYDNSGIGAIDLQSDSYNAYMTIGTYTGGIELWSTTSNALMGVYTNDSWLELYNSGDARLRSAFAVRLGTDDKYEIEIKDNATGATTSSNTTKNSVFIGSQNSTFNSGITNSVILGGSAITAAASNTVYVPNLNIKTVGSGSPIINLGLDSSGNVVTGTTGGGSAPEKYWTSGSTATSILPINVASAFATMTNAGATSLLFGWNSKIDGGSDNYNIGFNSTIKGGQANWNFGGNNNVSDAGGDIYAFAIGQSNNVRGWSIGIGNSHTMTNGSNAYGNVAIGYNNYHNSAQGTISLGSNCYVNAANSIATGYNTRTNASYSWAGGYSPSSTYRVIANSEGSFCWMNSSGTQELGTYAEKSTILGGLDHKINTSATGSTIIGGVNNRVNSSVVNSTILGGSAITATTSNTTYVPALTIVNSSTPASSGATGDIGSVTWDDNYMYVKTNTGWGRIALDYNF